MEQYDRIILGAGIYGLHAALICAKRREKVLVLEIDEQAFSRASFVNQARVHRGYHYPRSISTALKSAKYFNRFCEDFSFAINKHFSKVYAISSTFSWTSAVQFKKFCDYAGIECEETTPGKFFRPGAVEGAFVTREFAFDAEQIKKHYLEELAVHTQTRIQYSAKIRDIIVANRCFEITLADGQRVSSPFLLNATYASVNQINAKLGFELLKLKYEICEIILGTMAQPYQDVGVTVMDGPFFSIMPFGLAPYQSLTSVTFTPHVTSYCQLPTFSCQNAQNACSPNQLNNCNTCGNRPTSSWPYMSALANKYLRDEMKYCYCKSLYAIKPILLASEVDDSRPTVIRKFSDAPVYISVLSGKINTIYDIEEVL